MFSRLSGVAFALCAAAALAAPGGPALAGPIADGATQAEQAIASGDSQTAIAAFDGATDAFWSAIPLAFRVATFATGVSGFGQYTPVSDATFHAGDGVTIYLEPVGYGFLPADGGSGYTVRYQTGLEIRTPGGLVLGKTDAFGTAEWTGQAKNHEVQASVSVTLPAALKPGSYLLLLTLTDAATQKQATATLPFTIAE
ncbi:MAG TPA: hypothetical protein VG894_12205 [Bauldia sp.]|nr:hypothetical protein [Bauldia sp.]